MKICTVCKLEKSYACFAKNASKRDGLQAHCKECNKLHSKRYYARNRIKHLAAVSANKQTVRSGNQQRLLNYFKVHHCVDCGNSDIRVLEFDHLYDKDYNISVMLATGYSWAAIEKEFAKCQVVCSNCHRIRTHERSSSYRVNSLVFGGFQYAGI